MNYAAPRDVDKFAVFLLGGSRNRWISCRNRPLVSLQYTHPVLDVAENGFMTTCKKASNKTRTNTQPCEFVNISVVYVCIEILCYLMPTWTSQVGMMLYCSCKARLCGNISQRLERTVCIIFMWLSVCPSNCVCLCVYLPLCLSVYGLILGRSIHPSFRPSNPIQSHPIQSHPIPSNPVPSPPLPSSIHSYLCNAQVGRISHRRRHLCHCTWITRIL